MNNINKPNWPIFRNIDSIFLKIFIGLLFGVLLADNLNIEFIYFVISFSISILLSIIYIATIMFFNVKFRMWLSHLLIVLITCSCGGILLCNSKTPQLNSDKYESIYLMKVDDLPVVKDKYCSINATILRNLTKPDSLYVGRKVLLNIRRDSSERVIFYDSLHINTTLLVKTNLISTHTQCLDWQFDYNKYLRRHGYSALCYSMPKMCRILKSDYELSFINKFSLLQKKLENCYRLMNIDDDNLSIISAITLGDKSMLSYSQKQNFSAVGASHILVVSGMHVGYIFAIILYILSMVYKQRHRLLVVLLGLSVMWFYAFLTGLSPSVVRATFMFSMILFMKFAGLRYQVRNAIFLSATILVIVNPFVIYDIGFQLSYLAVLSIIYYYPILQGLFKIRNVKSSLLKIVINTVLIAVSAQILTAPFVIYYFNQFPLYFIITNCVVAVFAPIIFLGGILGLILANIPFIGMIYGIILNYILGVFNSCIEFISSMPLVVVKMYLSLSIVMAIYILIYFISESIEEFKLKSSKRVINVSRIVIGIIILIVVKVENGSDHTKQLIVYNDYELLVNIVSPQLNEVYTSISEEKVEKKFEKLWLMKRANRPHYNRALDLKSNYFIFDNLSYLLLRENTFYGKINNEDVLDVDCLIIDSNIYPQKNLSQFISPSRIVIGGGVWRNNINKFKKIFPSQDIVWHIISQDGIYIVNTNTVD